MARTPTARTLAVRGQLLVILRAEHPLPISTSDVLLRMANDHRNCTRRLDGFGNPTRGLCPYRPPEKCRAWCWYDPVYPQLCALMRLGLVERIRRDGMRCVYWRYVETETDEAFNAIVDALEATDA